MITLSIITVGMNHLSYIKNLLPSLYNDYTPRVSFEMIYVDNCSTDGSVEFIKQNYPLVKIIENEKTLGFGENNNKGVAEAQGKYIAIINPDIILIDNSLDILLNYAEENPTIGILAPKLLNADKTLQYSIRGFISLPVFWNRILTKNNDATTNKVVANYLCKDLDYKKTQPIDWAIGAALFLSKENYNQLRGFDEDYFLYMEDEDLCLRSWKLGKPVVYLHTASMVHNHLRASAKIGKKSYVHFKSLCTFFKKHGLNIKPYRY